MDSLNLENYFKDKILPDLEKSRGGYDKVHTLEVVSWLKKIIENNPDLNLDETVLLISAYAHDWGYAGIFEDNQTMTFELVESAKESHMELGAENLKALLEDEFFSFLTEEQEERCIHLVAIHDKKNELKDTDELILMEADMLSSLELSDDKPRFDADSNRKFIEAFLATRLPKFITKFSKEKAEELIRIRDDYYEKSMELLQKSQQFIGKLLERAKDNHDLIHSEKTVYWIKQLKPDADEALLVAGALHDIERAVNGDWKAGTSEEAFLRKHQNLSSQEAEKFLRNENASQEFIERVKHLILAHETGGDEDQNMLCDADVLAWLEDKAPRNVKKHKERGKPKEVMIEKLDHLMSRLLTDKAKEISKKFYDEAIGELDKI